MPGVTYLPVRLDWDHTAAPVKLPARFHHLHIDPAPGAPFGRKGAVMLDAWAQLAGPGFAGMLVLDGDVVIDPADHLAMLRAIERDPAAVWTAPVRIWPVSTQRRGWTWAHWDQQASQAIDLAPNWFSFCYTYLPRALLGACRRAGMARWAYPHVDTQVSATAQRARIPAKVVPECWPKHLHY